MKDRIFLVLRFLATVLFFEKVVQSENLNSDAGQNVIYPYFVDESGDVITWNSKYYEKMKEHIPIARSGFYDSVFVRLPLTGEGKNWTLQLRPKERLLASRSHIEYDHGNYSYIRKLNGKCAYEGFVIDDIHSTAALSLCDGISGVITTDNITYIIQPRSVINVGDGQEHVIKRMDSSVTRLPKPDLSTTHLGRKTHKRDKRDAREREYYLELLLVADQSIKDFHGDSRADEFLVTLINIVDDLYHHRTLGVKVNIVITKLMYISQQRARGFIIIGDAIQTLSRFCQWMSSFVNSDESSPDHFDFALFITKENIGPSGYAPVTGMCDPTRSCAVVRDEGFTSSFIAAHEMGHVFGIVHDGQGNNCAGRPSDGRIMAPLVQSTFAQHFWSTCAAEYLLSTIGTLNCLKDNPIERTATTYQTPYGSRWSSNEQCRQEFGEGFELCMAFTLPPCGALWCSTPDNYLLCKSKKGPALSGTECGYDMWCIGGQCVSKTINPDEDVDGGWSEFSNWMTCSRSCDTGIQVRVRTCSNPHPQRRGKPCEGPAGEFRLCNTDPCGDGGDFWAAQCTTLNWEVVAGRRHTWLPYQTGETSRVCKLTCKSNDTNQVYKTKENLIDGTFCSYEDKNKICIRGSCRSVGCDRVLDSTLKEDACGNCNGDNSTCAEITGSYNQKPTRGYQRIFIFPKGAWNIVVDETVRQRHFMALRSREGLYLLNGNRRPYRRKHLVHRGARWVYQNGRNVTESLKCKGPLNSEIEVMVFGSRYGARTANFTFRYFINQNSPGEGQELLSKNNSRYDFERFVWDSQGWSECSRSCGGGKQHEIFVCIDQQTARQANSTRSCSEKLLPTPQVRPCNDHKCDVYSWDPQNWNHCSHTCGRKGTQIRAIRCLHVMENGDLIPVDPSLCDFNTRPISQQSCNVTPCPGHWKVGPWTECTRTCGSGIQKRRVECIGTYFSKCTARAPHNFKPCSNRSCSEVDDDEPSTTPHPR